ncbi:hypothetical protein EXE43_24095 [Halorubrum sp. SS5]|uniref:hypothetical protein n=1 Tax=Halorubrum sp. SP3 TaxID=1537265 RepID=UPI000B8107CE|nr:hypothetical protein [Halorubrum sp. SP3]TKX53759.1 hypothetical protein EXE44_17225 [Halorubrum sp. SS7]TKX83468.1 hypothetical protein EXE43_24095 [Halorubrum sp. SS5]
MLVVNIRSDKFVFFVHGHLKQSGAFHGVVGVRKVVIMLCYVSVATERCSNEVALLIDHGWVRELVDTPGIARLQFEKSVEHDGLISRFLVSPEEFDFKSLWLCGGIAR